MLSERRRRRERAQRGSVLGAVLIIVAFLSILGGALMNEISSQFVLSRALSLHMADEATVNSSVEYAIGQLQTRTVPVHCSTDAGSNWSVNLNGKSATATPTCQAIVPDLARPLATGTFPADGTHVVIGGRNTYLVGDFSGDVYNYAFGQTSYLWRVNVGAGVTGPPSQSPDATRANHLITLVPAGDAVALIDDQLGGGAAPRCTMAAGGRVTSQPGVENPPSGSEAFFPNYAFFGDATGRLWVYDATTNGSCTLMASASGRWGAVVAGPLVLSGSQTITRNNNGERQQDTTTTTVEVFAVVSGGGSSHLVQYEYSEVTNGSGGPNRSLDLIDSRSLPGTNVGGADYSSTTPDVRNPIRLAITSGSGQVTLAAITAQNGRNGGDGRNEVSDLTYTMSIGSTANLGGSFSRAPYWCHCPSGDLIGAGNQNGSLYLLNTSLNALLRYDGGVAINTTPAADANGDWYFGADDGYVYDVEPPARGPLMFKAARFGPGGSVHSSPVVGSTGDGCSTGPCLYFGATGTSYFAQIGKVRVMDLNACLSAQPCSRAGTGNARLWARLEVGPPSILGGHGVNVTGWSYYSP